MRPWTYIATDRNTGQRVSDHMFAGFDSKHAVEVFVEEHPDKQLEALLPGSHRCVTFRTKPTSSMLYTLGD